MRDLYQLSQEEAFCVKRNKVPLWLNDLKNLGLYLKVPIISDDVGCYLRLFCQLQQPQKILEIGCGISYSSHWMLLDSPQSEFTGIDMNPDRIHICKDYFAISNIGKKIQLRCQMAEDFFAEAQPDNEYDLIFQDAAKRSYVSMLDDCCKALKKGGWFIVDNIFFEGRIFSMPDKDKKKYTKTVNDLQTFLEEVEQSPKLSSYFLPIGDGILIARKVV